MIHNWFQIESKVVQCSNVQWVSNHELGFIYFRLISSDTLVFYEINNDIYISICITVNKHMILFTRITKYFRNARR